MTPNLFSGVSDPKARRGTESDVFSVWPTSGPTSGPGPVFVDLKNQSYLESRKNDLGAGLEQQIGALILASAGSENFGSCLHGLVSKY